MLPLAACASSSTLHHAGRAPNAFAAGAPRHAWFARVRRGTGVVALSSSQQDAGQRPVALPSGVLWMLDALSGGYYNVRGEEFVINRAEARHDDEPSFKRRFRRRNKGNAVARVPGSAPSGASMLQRAVWEQPAALMLVSDGALIDVPLDDDVTVELASLHVSGPGAAAPAPASATAAAAAAVAPSSATGIVHVPSSESTAEQDDYMQTSSTSPRRTKMLRFKCLADGCGTVNVKPINPISFNKGTAFAQCAKCGVYHLITDHLNMFNQMKGPVYRQKPRPINMADVPPALRPRPDDNGGSLDDFFGTEGRAAGAKRA